MLTSTTQAVLANQNTDLQSFARLMRQVLVDQVRFNPAVRRAVLLALLLPILAGMLFALMLQAPEGVPVAAGIVVWAIVQGVMLVQLDQVEVDAGAYACLQGLDMKGLMTQAQREMFALLLLSRAAAGVRGLTVGMLRSPVTSLERLAAQN